MSNCLCLACDRANPLTLKFCTECGAKLQIQDRYRALKVIGQGGFGKTFLAQDEGKPSQPRCVIKQFIYNDPATLREAQRLFEQEAVRLDDLGKHSQIPELLAHCEQDGRQYLVQEFIDGENLLQELNRAGRFNEAKIKELLLDLLPVLQFIHAGNVIHRDIKPENIIRRRSDGKLVLVDFGAAKMATKTALAKTGTTIGSPEYTAPEQARGKAVFASDIYGLGVTCIYLLTQVSPFDLFSDHEGAWVWRQFLNGITVNDKLGQILDRMIEQPLGMRYQTSARILQHLGVSQAASNTGNNSGVYSFKAEELNGVNRVTISRATSTQQTKSSNNTSSNQNVAKSAVELRSDRNIDYKELESLLKKKDWKAADDITTEIILKITGREKEGWITNVNMINFPRTDLLTIDRLWLYYSERKFGFSCQVKTWFDCGGEIEEYDEGAYKRFLIKIGWYDPIKFAKKINHYKFMDKTNNGKNAPDASLPNLFYEVGISSNAVGILSSLAQKFIEEPSSIKQAAILPKKTKLNTPKSSSHKVASKPVVTQESESITNNKGCMIVVLIAFLLMSIATANPVPIVIMILGFYAGQKEK
jgi:serine/threonine protein kinase